MNVDLKVTQFDTYQVIYVNEPLVKHRINVKTYGAKTVQFLRTRLAR